MKNISKIFFLFSILVLTNATYAQVTNVVVNGVSSNFTMASGDNISWSYNVPAGSTTLVEIWIDVNSNGIIDPLTDKIMFTFNQTDGDTNGNGGPPDMDGIVNGAVIFGQPVGLAPAHYIMKFTNNGTSTTIAGSISPLASPAYTISGHVTPPSGKSAQYILVEANRSEQYQPNFWDALTDAFGNYTIQMNSDTAGNPWHIRLQTGFPPSLPSPQETLVVIDGNKTGIDFSYIAAAAQVAGYLTDENNVPIVDRDVQLMDFTYYHYYNGRTNGSGFFQIGIPVADLQGQTWTLETSINGQFTTTELRAKANLPIINSGDSLFRNLKVYYTNAQISGTVNVDGNLPSYPIYLAAQSDSGEASTASDSLTGNFTMLVSDKIFNYQFIVWNLPFGWNVGSVVAHPGDTGVIINITTTTGVIEREPGVPKSFALQQNYPNPFNPSTDIAYDLPKASFVKLSIFNILGEEVARLVDEEQNPGKYKAILNASNLSSGVYFYRLTAGAFSSMKKMMFIK